MKNLLSKLFPSKEPKKIETISSKVTRKSSLGKFLGYKTSNSGVSSRNKTADMTAILTQLILPKIKYT